MNLGLVQQKPPMRLAALGLEFGAFVVRQLQSRAVIDRRLTAGELKLALDLEFFGVS